MGQRRGGKQTDKRGKQKINVYPKRLPQNLDPNRLVLKISRYIFPNSFATVVSWNSTTATVQGFKATLWDCRSNDQMNRRKSAVKTSEDSDEGKELKERVGNEEGLKKGCIERKTYYKGK